MKHIDLDLQEESVKRFVLSLSIEPGSAVLEVGGRAVACVVPVKAQHRNGSPAEEWTDAKNDRRCDLKQITGMTEDEQGDDAESINRWIEEFDAIPPLPMTPEEEADMIAWRAKVKAFSLDAVRGQMEAGLPIPDWRS